MLKDNLLNPKVLFLTVLPKNLISFLTGVLVRLHLPRKWSIWLNRSFVGLFDIDMQEAEHALEDYSTVESVFTRALKPGARPLADSALVSPSDGYLVYSEKITQGQALQAKGLYYSVEELIFGGKKSSSYDPKWYQTIYLAPHNYHRVHCPIDGQLTGIFHIAGTLWPVNDTFVKGIPKLFNVNERLVFQIQSEEFGLVYLVMVGAFNVGRICTPFVEDLFTNDSPYKVQSCKDYPINAPLKKGDELGTFMLGSTVVMIYESGHFQPFCGKRPVKMGEAIN